MSNYVIAQPKVEDADELAQMHAMSWLEAYPNEKASVTVEYIRDYIERFTSEEGQTKRKAYIDESYINQDYFFRIARNNRGKIVGFVDARRSAEEFELNGLYIDKSEYGSGLAMELAEPALQWLGKEHDIKVTVVSYNLRAQNFYKKLGFKLLPGKVRFHNNTPLTVVDMERK